MSVVGATRWYDRVVAGQYNPESDLVLNKYCKAFIDEVKRLIPTEFYTCYTKHVSIHENGRMKAVHPFTCFDGKRTTQDCSAPSSPDTSGSLVPFGITGQCYRRNAALGLGNKQAHNSVSSWTIDKFGRVMIKRACILASGCITASTTRSALNHNIPVTYEYPSLSNELSIFINNEPFNLTNPPNLYEGARAGEFEIYLVVISSLLENAQYAPGFGVPSSHGLIQGIVLRAMEQESETTRGSRPLVSVGTFHAVPQTEAGNRFELPEECSVDWIVL